LDNNFILIIRASQLWPKSCYWLFYKEC